jgi:hypothetical protein
VPNKHKKLIASIYDDLKLDYSFAKKEIKNTGTSKIKSNYSSNFELGSIFVTSIGKDNLKYIKESFFNLLFRMKAKVILLYIVMEDSSIETLIEEVEKENFFFCGILPSFVESKDVIMYEFLPENIDESSVQIYSQKAKELVKYIANEKRKILW